MSFITDDHKCSHCGEKYILMRPRNERDDPSICPFCGEEGERTLSAPGLMKIALPDGTDRGKNFQMMKEVAKLEKEKASMPKSKRKDHQKQIDTLKKI